MKKETPPNLTVVNTWSAGVKSGGSGGSGGTGKKGSGKSGVTVGCSGGVRECASLLSLDETRNGTNQVAATSLAEKCARAKAQAQVRNTESTMNQSSHVIPISLIILHFERCYNFTNRRREVRPAEGIVVHCHRLELSPEVLFGVGLIFNSPILSPNYLNKRFFFCLHRLDVIRFIWRWVVVFLF